MSWVITIMSFHLRHRKEIHPCCLYGVLSDLTPKYPRIRIKGQIPPRVEHIRVNSLYLQIYWCLITLWQTYWGAFLVLCAASLRVRAHETPREGAIAPQHIFLILGTVVGASNREESKIEECCSMHLTVKVSRKEVSLKYSHKCIISDYG